MHFFKLCFRRQRFFPLFSRFPRKGFARHFKRSSDSKLNLFVRLRDPGTKDVCSNQLLLSDWQYNRIEAKIQEINDWTFLLGAVVIVCASRADDPRFVSPPGSKSLGIYICIWQCCYFLHLTFFVIVMFDENWRPSGNYFSKNLKKNNYWILIFFRLWPDNGFVFQNLYFYSIKILVYADVKSLLPCDFYNQVFA
jgi:hypothetical protein